MYTSNSSSTRKGVSQNSHLVRVRARVRVRVRARARARARARVSRVRVRVSRVRVKVRVSLAELPHGELEAESREGALAAAQVARVARRLGLVRLGFG